MNPFISKTCTYQTVTFALAAAVLILTFIGIKWDISPLVFFGTIATGACIPLSARYFISKRAYWTTTIISLVSAVLLLIMTYDSTWLSPLAAFSLLF